MRINMCELNNDNHFIDLITRYLYACEYVFFEYFPQPIILMGISR